MCAIVGIVEREEGRSPSVSLLELMTGTMSHRCPDDAVLFISGPVGLGHRRLAVIDPTGGGQPMVDAASGRIRIYNGEIYNFRELRRGFDRQHRFETDC